MLDQEGQFQITFTKNMGGAAGFMTNLLLAPPACSSISPRWLLTVMFVPASGGVTLEAASQYVHAGPFCQLVRENLDGKKVRQQIEGFFQQIKSAAEQNRASSMAGLGTSTMHADYAPVTEGSTSGQKLYAVPIQPKGGAQSSAQQPTSMVQGAPQQQSSVDFWSNPSGATIELDGNYVGSTPSTLVLPLGSHTITMNRDGFETWQKTIVISPGNIRVAAYMKQSNVLVLH
jgi:hypothetical protein